MQFVQKGQSVHFIGIGGIGMSALAFHLLAQGVPVSGSDAAPNDVCRALENAGAMIHAGHDGSNLPENCGLAVYTPAVAADNPELLLAKKRGVKTVRREQLLGAVFGGFSRKIAVCGTHGKTTVTAMTDYLFRALSLPHTSFIGGVSADINGNYVGGGDVVLAEACEFQRNFLYLFPDVLVCLNIELDHPDCYADLAETEGAFAEFFRHLQKGGVLVANGDNVKKNLLTGSNHVTFGTGRHNAYRLENVQNNADGKYVFDFVRGKEKIPVRLPIAGAHNVYNAAAALTVCDVCGLNVAEAAAALKAFRGTKRRWQEIPCAFCTLVEDYAHHPTEIAAAVRTAKETARSRIFLLFQPHTYTRTQTLQKDFETCFAGVHLLGMLPIYAARELPVAGVTSENLLSGVRGVAEKRYFPSFEDAAGFVRRHAKKDDLVLVVGAGDIWKISDLLKK